MVIPVGTLSQDLMVVRKQADGTTLNETIVPVRFVPLTRDGGNVADGAPQPATVQRLSVTSTSR